MYVNSIHDGRLTCEQEFIDDVTHYNDRVMLALRTIEGIDLDTLTEAERKYLFTNAKKHIDQGLLTRNGQRLRLSREGLFVSDMVMSDLMRA